MTALTIWCGPLTKAQRGELRWPGSTALYLPCSTQGGPSCPDLAGQSLDQVAPGADEVYLAAFAEGGAVVNAWMDDARVKGIFLADALVSVDPNEVPSTGFPSTNQHLLDFIVDAARDPSLRAVVTDSGASGQRLAALAAEAEHHGVGWNVHHPSSEVLRVGGQDVLSPDRTSLDLGGAAQLPPARMWSAGGAFLIDFAGSVTRPELLTQVAPILWPRLFTGVIPVPSTSTPAATSKPRSKALLVAAGVLGVAAILGAVWLGSRTPETEHQERSER